MQIGNQSKAPLSYNGEHLCKNSVSSQVYLPSVGTRQRFDSASMYALDHGLTFTMEGSS